MLRLLEIQDLALKDGATPAGNAVKDGPRLGRYVEFPLKVDKVEMDDGLKSKRDIPLGWVLSKKVREKIADYYGTPRPSCDSESSPDYNERAVANCAATMVLKHLQPKQDTAERSR